MLEDRRSLNRSAMPLMVHGRSGRKDILSFTCDAASSRRVLPVACALPASCWCVPRTPSNIRLEDIVPKGIENHEVVVLGLVLAEPMVLLQEGQQLRGRSVVAHLLGSDLFKLEHCAEELVTKAGTLALFVHVEVQGAQRLNLICQLAASEGSLNKKPLPANLQHSKSRFPLGEKVHTLISQESTGRDRLSQALCRC